MRLRFIPSFERHYRHYRHRNGLPVLVIAKDAPKLSSEAKDKTYQQEVESPGLAITFTNDQRSIQSQKQLNTIFTMIIPYKTGGEFQSSKSLRHCISLAFYFFNGRKADGKSLYAAFHICFHHIAT